MPYRAEGPANRGFHRRPGRVPWRSMRPPSALEPRRIPEPARAPPPVRDLGLLTTVGKAICTSAIRLRSPAARLRWSDRREDFPHRNTGAGQGADGQERRDRAGGGQGWLRRQATARSLSVDREGWAAGRLRPAIARSSAACCNSRTIWSTRFRTASARSCRPPNTRRYDGDDPYLVVAADKGTATFSDIANEIAKRLRLLAARDAFASSGSRGYDHKARGNHRRTGRVGIGEVPHFRELGTGHPGTGLHWSSASAICPVMSFGNGMLLSRHIRLVAAFDHRHDLSRPGTRTPRAPSAERERLFRLPRSSWGGLRRRRQSRPGAAYIRARSSRYRSAAEVAQAPRLPPGVTTMTPNELDPSHSCSPRSICSGNGGVGTFVKASSEPQLAAGDRANDPVFGWTARNLRCFESSVRAAISAFTQLGRIECARSGGRIQHRRDRQLRRSQHVRP